MKRPRSHRLADALRPHTGPYLSTPEIPAHAKAHAAWLDAWTVHRDAAANGELRARIRELAARGPCLQRLDAAIQEEHRRLRVQRSLEIERLLSGVDGGRVYRLARRFQEERERGDALQRAADEQPNLALFGQRDAAAGLLKRAFELALSPDWDAERATRIVEILEEWKLAVRGLPPVETVATRRDIDDLELMIEQLADVRVAHDEALRLVEAERIAVVFALRGNRRFVREIAEIVRDALGQTGPDRVTAALWVAMEQVGLRAWTSAICKRSLVTEPSTQDSAHDNLMDELTNRHNTARAVGKIRERQARSPEPVRPDEELLLIHFGTLVRTRCLSLRRRVDPVVDERGADADQTGGRLMGVRPPSPTIWQELIIRASMIYGQEKNKTFPMDAEVGRPWIFELLLERSRGIPEDLELARGQDLVLIQLATLAPWKLDRLARVLGVEPSAVGATVLARLAATPELDVWVRSMHHVFYARPGNRKIPDEALEYLTRWLLLMLGLKPMQVVHVAGGPENVYEGVSKIRATIAAYREKFPARNLPVLPQEVKKNVRNR